MTKQRPSNAVKPARPVKPAGLGSNMVIFWAGIFVLLCAFIWIFNAILLPFVLGAGIAYLLNPLVNRLARNKISRTISALLILAIFFISIGTLLALLLPVAYRELLALAAAVPDYIASLQKLAAPYSEWILARATGVDQESLESAIQDHIGTALTMTGDMLTRIATGGRALIGLLGVLIITPIVAFFMMKEWPAMTGWIDRLLPRAYYDTVRGLMTQIDTKISGFVRGQLSIVALLGLAYIVALSLAGLNFAILIGLIAGFLSIIPLIGSTVGLILSVAVAWFQAGEWGYVALIGGIFITGQVLETNIITPRILGKTIGMHPLWVLFALLAGGSLFGIVGMLVAVPVAAAIGVLLVFAIERYKDSPYYDPDTADTDPDTKQAPQPAKDEA